MSYADDDAVKLRIREATDIVELVSQYVPLKRSGRNFVGRCPWHDDSKPSLQVNAERQTFKCWVCDIGGDVFSFIMKVENVTFREALEILADKAGVTLPKKSKPIYLKSTKSASGGDPNDELASLGDEEYGGEYGGIVPTEKPQEISRQILFEAADWLAKTYHEALLTLDEAAEARKYLKDRGITDSCIRQFQIGYAPAARDWLVEKVKRNSRRLQILEIVGNLVERNADPDKPKPQNANPIYYDRFYGRVMFPIRDTQNRTVAFGGRVLPGSTSPAKYINSPETPLFSKHRMLYGLDLARFKMKETRRVLIMEGYTDCIIAHKFGFKDAVAVLGTALGPEHVRILQRYVDKMILMLDGDEAGRKRAGQVLDFFVAQGVDMSVMTLPDEADPCEFLEEHGSEAFELLLKTETVDALEFAFRNATRGIDLENDILGSSRALDQLLGTIAQAPMKGIGQDDPQRIRVEKMIQNLSHRFLVGEDQIRQRLKEKRKKLEQKPLRIENVTETNSGQQYSDSYDESATPGLWDDPEFRPDALEREMMELWLNDPTAIYEFWNAVPVERCRSPITRTVYEKCNDLVEHNIPATFDRLMVAFDDPKMKSFLSDLFESGLEKRRAARTRSETANGSEEPVYRDETSELEESLRSELDDDEPIPAEYKALLVKEILDGFDRRDRMRDRMKDVNRLRDDSLTDEEKLSQLLQMQEQLRRLQK